MHTVRIDHHISSSLTNIRNGKYQNIHLQGEFVAHRKWTKTTNKPPGAVSTWKSLQLAQTLSTHTASGAKNTREVEGNPHTPVCVVNSKEPVNFSFHREFFSTLTTRQQSSRREQVCFSPSSKLKTKALERFRTFYGIS